MGNYRAFDQLRSNELTVIRHGWFRPWYELTDGQFMYGKLSYTGWTKRTAMLETASIAWTIVPKGVFSRTLYIHQSDGQTIGEIKPEMWSRRINIIMNNGFLAFFTTKKIFTKTFTLGSDKFGDLAYIEQKLWKLKKPFVITFDQAMFKTVPDMPLFILSGVYLALMRQQQQAAAAGA
jgi:hypothetical protein